MKHKVKQPIPEILRYPKPLFKLYFTTLILIAFESLWLDAASFIIQLSKEAITNGALLLALILFTANYAREPLECLLKTYIDERKLDCDEAEVIHLGTIGPKILIPVKGKIKTRDEANGFETNMTSKNVIDIVKKSICLGWDRQLFWCSNTIRIISAIIMIVGFFWVTNLEIRNVALFYLITALGITSKIFFSIKGIKIHNRRRAASHKANLVVDNAMQDIINIEPLNQDHTNFMIKNLVDSSIESYQLRRSTKRESNLFKVIEATISTLITLGIALLKFVEIGFDNVSLETFISVIALITIYRQLTLRATSVVEVFFEYRNIKEDYKVVKDDFEKIMKIYEIEKDLSDAKPANLLSFILNPFTVSYKGEEKEKPFTLTNENTITLLPGNFVMLHGVTGAGKTTLLKLLTQNLRFDNFEPTINVATEGVAKSLIHQTFMKLGNKPMIEELTLGKEEYDKQKLLYILENLHLVEELKQKNPDVLELLSSTDQHHFSAGQVQRLALARTLFNLTDDIQIIAFDESTNNLNDDIAKQALEFIRDYCKDKLVIFSTHQVEICKKVATTELTFTRISGNHYKISEVK